MAVNLPEARPPLVGTLVLHLPAALDDAALLALAALNPDLRLERSAQGDLIVMPPAGYDSSRRNAEVVMQLALWAKGEGTGQVTDSSGGFRLPNGTVRAPDAAWTSHARLQALSPAERRGFAPLCPEFVLELLSPTDDLRATQAKMQEYQENGAQLGWLLDPETKTVYVYAQGGMRVLEHPERVSGEPVLRGFGLELAEVW